MDIKNDIFLIVDRVRNMKRVHERYFLASKIAEETFSTVDVDCISYKKLSRDFSITI